jgi:hypothetical protein
LKHGLQSSLRSRIATRSDSGGVKPGDDDPYTAVSGLFSAPPA